MIRLFHRIVWGIFFLFLSLTALSQGAANEVYLDDRENHSWSYYSDPANPVRSLNPADVKITYYGYGTNTMYSSNAATPSGNPDVNVAASQVGIGIDAPGKNTYVYLKTLERRGGTTATSKAAATGPCKYRVIPNPFSIRPTHGSGDTRWRGFYRWRVKRLVGGAIYTDMAKTQSVAVGGYVDPEQLLWLAPAAEYGMEIDLEAIWARAFVFTATEAATGINAIGLTTAQYATGPNAHERNFVVITPSNIGTITSGSETVLAYSMHPSTIMGVYPDGTNGSNSTRLTAVPGSVFLNQHYFCMADTKFEYIWINGPAKTFAGNDFNMTIGRRCVNQNGGQSLRRVVGMSSVTPYRNSRIVYTIDTNYVETTDTTWNEDHTSYTIAMKAVYDTTDIQTVYSMALKDAYDEYDFESAFFTRIESGQYKDVLPHWCGIDPSGLNSDWYWTPGVVGESNQPGIYYGSWNCPFIKISHTTFGSDYDRSINQHNQLKITNYIFGSYSHWFNELPATTGVDQYNWYVKSGDFLPGRFDYGQGGATAFYLGGVGYDTGYMGHRCIYVEGGLLQGIAGGMDESYDVNGNYQYAWDFVDLTDTNIWIRVYGGHLRGHIYGGGEYVESGGKKRIVVTGGIVNGWIAGGANGTNTTAGEVNGDTYVYVGGRARVEHSAADPKIGAAYGGNVFGAGCGHPDATSTTATTGKVKNSTVVIADSCYISRNVYGGGHFGGVVGTGARIYILGGTVEGKVFGGANQQMGKQVDIVMRGGQVKGGVYGGSNISGAIQGPVNVNIQGGTVGYPDCADTLGCVFGCGYGENTSVQGSVAVAIGSALSKRPHVNDPVIHSNVYGGGFKAPYNSEGKTFRVTTWNGEIKGSVYGGGLGTTAVINGNTNVNIFGTTTVRENIYGGGNMGKVSGNTQVIIGEDNNTYTITAVPNNAAMGSVSGGGSYPANTDILLRATPASGHWFKQWSDGNTSNPRNVTVSRNATFTAEFEVTPTFTITVTSADPAMGTVEGGGTYLAESVISIRATANNGHRFTRWSDGNTSNPRSVTVRGDVTYTAEFEESVIGWVDLGLPSGLLWTEVNLGAEQPSDYGDYYAWADITPNKANYTNATTAYYSGSAYTKYNSTDGLTTLQPEDDIATITLGGDAHIPTMAEWQELLSNTTVANETLNGVAGRRFTSKINGNSFFVPFTGYKSGTTTYGATSCTYFWSSTLSSSTNSNAVDVYITTSSANFYSGSNGEGRYYGFPIRAVRSR